MIFKAKPIIPEKIFEIKEKFAILPTLLENGDRVWLEKYTARYEWVRDSYVTGHYMGIIRGKIEYHPYREWRCTRKLPLGFDFEKEAEEAKAQRKREGVMNWEEFKEYCDTLKIPETIE